MPPCSSRPSAQRMSGTYSHEKRPGLDSGSPYVHMWEGATTGGLLGGMRTGRGGRSVDELVLLLLLLLLNARHLWLRMLPLK